MMVSPAGAVRDGCGPRAAELPVAAWSHRRSPVQGGRDRVLGPRGVCGCLSRHWWLCGDNKCAWAGSIVSVLAGEGGTVGWGEPTWVWGARGCSAIPSLQLPEPRRALSGAGAALGQAGQSQDRAVPWAGHRTRGSGDAPGERAVTAPWGVGGGHLAAGSQLELSTVPSRQLRGGPWGGGQPHPMFPHGYRSGEPGQPTEHPPPASCHLLRLNLWAPPCPWDPRQCWHGPGLTAPLPPGSFEHPFPPQVPRLLKHPSGKIAPSQPANCHPAGSPKGQPDAHGVSCGQ